MSIKLATLRRERMRRFHHARKIEARFQLGIMRVAAKVGMIVRYYGKKEDILHGELEKALGNYATKIKPWARSITNRMHAELEARDLSTWRSLAKDLGGSLRQQIENSPMGLVLEMAQDSQVELITSLPLDAAERVHKLTRENFSSGTRAEDLTAKILAQNDVSAARARLIARTETARTATLVTQARAESLGSEAYIWRTSSDSDVRPIHAWLEGKVIRWDSPPIAGERGERAHAGCIYNCRCYPEPILTDKFLE